MGDTLFVARLTTSLLTFSSDPITFTRYTNTLGASLFPSTCLETFVQFTGTFHGPVICENELLKWKFCHKTSLYIYVSFYIWRWVHKNPRSFKVGIQCIPVCHAGYATVHRQPSPCQFASARPLCCYLPDTKLIIHTAFGWLFSGWWPAFCCVSHSAIKVCAFHNVIVLVLPVWLNDYNHLKD